MTPSEDAMRAAEIDSVRPMMPSSTELPNCKTLYADEDLEPLT
jgi:hypothetical protein